MAFVKKRLSEGKNLRTNFELFVIVSNVLNSKRDICQMKAPELTFLLKLEEWQDDGFFVRPHG